MPLRPEFTVAGTLIAADVCIEVLYDHSNALLNKHTITIGIHNPEDTVGDWNESRLGLILPQEFRQIDAYSTVQLQDRRFLYDLGTIGQLLPDQWQMVQVDLPLVVVQASMQSFIAAELKMFTRYGPLSTSFHLRFVKSSH